MTQINLLNRLNHNIVDDLSNLGLHESLVKINNKNIQYTTVDKHIFEIALQVS